MKVKIANIPATGIQPIVAKLRHAADQSIRAMMTPQSVAATAIFATKKANERDTAKARRRSSATVWPAGPDIAMPSSFDATADKPGSSSAEELTFARSYVTNSAVRRLSR
ncbi:MAG: hypothetical protein LOD94_03485 [Gammaproteobacteria bacterium]